jgi:uncharacterized protein (DUF488 family)
LAPVLTVGHSVHAADVFLSLLRRHDVGEIVDVRSQPFSRWQPHFNRAALESAAASGGIPYRFAGDSLGGRPSDPRLFHGGGADYEAMALAPAFLVGIDAVLASASAGRRPVLMCSEKDPATCHRCLMVGRSLHQRGAEVLHVLDDGSAVSQADVVERIMKANRIAPDLFGDIDALAADAYRAQARRFAFKAKDSGVEGG